MTRRRSREKRKELLTIRCVAALLETQREEMSVTLEKHVQLTHTLNFQVSTEIRRSHLTQSSQRPSPLTKSLTLRT